MSEACHIRYNIKSVLLRVCNYKGERALRCEMVASFYACQPNHSYVDCLFRFHSDLTRGLVVAGVLHCARSELPTKGVLWSIVYRLVATQFS